MTDEQKIRAAALQAAATAMAGTRTPDTNETIPAYANRVKDLAKNFERYIKQKV
ncbi:hypothetical protein PV392_17875 [Streptomyces sp. ME03-5709C]|nr:hypothetical protein [Streptomyces sp. ME03-5709C]